MQLVRSIGFVRACRKHACQVRKSTFANRKPPNQKFAGQLSLQKAPMPLLSAWPPMHVPTISHGFCSSGLMFSPRTPHFYTSDPKPSTVNPKPQNSKSLRGGNYGGKSAKHQKDHHRRHHLRVAQLQGARPRGPADAPTGSDSSLCANLKRHDTINLPEARAPLNLAQNEEDLNLIITYEPSHQKLVSAASQSH